MANERRKITLHPTDDLTTNLYPKTRVDAIVDMNDQPFTPQAQLTAGDGISITNNTIGAIKEIGINYIIPIVSGQQITLDVSKYNDISISSTLAPSVTGITLDLSPVANKVKHFIGRISTENATLAVTFPSGTKFITEQTYTSSIALNPITISGTTASLSAPGSFEFSILNGIARLTYIN